ncbi:MAG: pilus assembly protein [Xanthomonadaceae bacterium]|nr:pilus assembly protein [Xanthomonadaceae bacterium]
MKIAPRSKQEGVVLYVAMVMLILLALIGIVGMQVAALQEKMSASYRNSALAFQRAERQTRGVECYVESQVNGEAMPTGCITVTVDSACDLDFDATNWAQERSLSEIASASARSIGKCIAGSTDLGMGVKPESEEANPIYQITAYATDFDSNPTADAAIDTIFRP